MSVNSPFGDVALKEGQELGYSWEAGIKGHFWRWKGLVVS